MGNNQSNNEMDFDCGGAVLFIVLFFFLIIIIAGGCGGYYYHNNCGCDSFENLSPIKTDTRKNYNALYTKDFMYTQPPGDVMAQSFSKSGQGTRGEFLPLQGIGAQTYMKNSAQNNHILPTANTGKIGGQPNYTDKDETTAWIGFQNFPHAPDSSFQSNSYLIQGANERACNPGQRCNNLPSPNWWPMVKKDNKGFDVQGSDLLVTCDSPNKGINNCREGKAFVRYKNMPEYKKVFADS